MSEEKLLPCPHCGRPVNHEYVPGDSFGNAHLKVWCGKEFNTLDSCGAYFQFDIGGEAELIKQYNTRTPDLRALDEAIAKVEKLIKEAYDGEWEMGLTEALEAMQQIRAKYEGGK